MAPPTLFILSPSLGLLQKPISSLHLRLPILHCIPPPRAQTQHSIAPRGQRPKSRNEARREARRAVKCGKELAKFNNSRIKRVLKVALLDEDAFDALMLVKHWVLMLGKKRGGSLIILIRLSGPNSHGQSTDVHGSFDQHLVGIDCSRDRELGFSGLDFGRPPLLPLVDWSFSGLTGSAKIVYLHACCALVDRPSADAAAPCARWERGRSTP